MRIVFLISTTGRGGAERVASILCNEWARAGHAVSMMTYDAPGARPGYALDPEIRVVPLDLMRPSRSALGSGVAFIRRAWRVRRAVRALRPDIVVAFMTETSIVAIFSGLGANWKTVISERVHPAHHPVARPTGWMRRIAYRWADGICVQTADIARWIRESVGADATVIPNPVDIDRFAAAAAGCADAGSGRRLVAMGRLDRQKGFDLLIEAFASIRCRHPDWRLTIYGEGPERQSLESQIATLGAGDAIALPGVTDGPERALAGADAVVHPSRYEGYPNVVAEALAAGKPVLATDCPGGTRELAGDGTYAALAPAGDAAGLARALDEFLTDDVRRDTLRRRARDAVAPLAAPAIAGRWVALFRQMLEKPA